MNESMNERLIKNADLQTLIAKNIRKLGLDIYQLAQIMCVPTPQVLKIFHGEAMPSLDALKRLRNYLRIPINTFFE